ncbi:hypothetical protein D3C87_1426870 [compost metagenome]
MSVGIELQHRATGVFDIATGKFRITLLGRRCDDLLALFEGLRVLEPVAVGGTHVIHADRGDGFHARVDLGGTDDKAAAATNPQHANALAVDKRPRAEVIHGGAEVLGVHVWQYRVTGLAFAFAPERQIQRQGNEALFRQFLRIEVGALLLYRAHGVANDNGRVACAAVQPFWQEQIAHDIELVLILEADLLHGHLVTFKEIICTVGHIGS